LQWQFIYRYDFHSAHESGSLFWYHAVMSFQFTESAPLPAKAGCETCERIVCSTISLCCITITWQQIFKGSLQVAGSSVLPHVTVESRHLGRYMQLVTAADGISHVLLYYVKRTLLPTKRIVCICMQEYQCPL